MKTECLSLTREELLEHARVAASVTDAERQAGYARLDKKIRTRLSILARRYYSWHTQTGLVLIDMNRERVPPVKKISKSDGP